MILMDQDIYYVLLILHEELKPFILILKIKQASKLGMFHSEDHDNSKSRIKMQALKM